MTTSPLMLLGCLALASASSAAVAQGVETQELNYDLRLDIPLTLVTTTLWIGTELLQPQLAADACRWCESNPFDESIRQALKWDDIDAGDAASNVAAFGLVPVAGFGLLALAQNNDGALQNFPLDALLVAEATTMASAINQGVKYSVGRERPFVHALNGSGKLATKRPSDNNTSFYSGHANFAFALAVSSGTVASLRGYSWAPWVWGVGLTLATTTAYLRIAGDRHYFTDVTVGAVAGSAVGFLVPFLLHSRAPRAPAIAAATSAERTLITLSWAL